MRDISVVLPAPEKPDDGHELALLDGQVDVREHLASTAARAEALADAFEFEEAMAHTHTVPACASTMLIRRSRTKPTKPMVMMHRMMCS